MTLYLSRLTLARDPGNAALSTLLDPDDPGAAMNAHHQLMWTLFGDAPDRRRDFLWRMDGRARFFALSHRPPRPHPLFDPPEIKEFAPKLTKGDRLAFALRANATKDRARATRNRRVDLVMDLLQGVPKSERANARPGLAEQAATEWITRQGAAHGFEPETLLVEGYSVVKLPRKDGSRAQYARLGLLDITGTLTVTEPESFTIRLGQGFGRARAFGCGLMLIRRA